MAEEEEQNPLITINRRAMQHIWSQVPKETKDGVEYVVYNDQDLDFLFHSGLVDTERFTQAQWLQAFETCRGEDGRYWVSQKRMIWLGQFRYHKIVNEPFDPLKLRTGRYTAKRLWQVYEKSIIPSCSLPKELIKRFYGQMVVKQKKFQDAFSKEYGEYQKSGEKLDTVPEIKFETEGDQTFIIIEEKDLIGLKELLDLYPSPRRKLELAVHQNRQEKLQRLADIAKNPQKSSFEAGVDFRKTTQKDLQNALLKTPVGDHAGGRKPLDETLDLGAIQKKGLPKKF